MTGLAALAAGLRSQRTVFRETALLGWHAATALAGNFTLKGRIHRGKAPLRGSGRSGFVLLSHLTLLLGLQGRPATMRTPGSGPDTRTVGRIRANPERGLAPLRNRPVKGCHVDPFDKPARRGNNPRFPGGVPEWLKGADCKSVGLRLRWFESSLLHQAVQVFCSSFRVAAAAQGGCSSMVEQKPSKLTTRVRFPSPAPVIHAHVAQW